MKKIIALFSITAAATGVLSAQETVTTKTLEDNPNRACNFVMAVDLMQIDFGFKNIDGFAASTGVWGFADYKNALGFDYTFRYGYLTLGHAFRDPENTKAHRQIELGGYLTLHKGTAIKNTKIVLKQTSDIKGGKEYTTTTYVRVPATHLIKTGLRAGFMDYGGVLAMSSDALEADYTLPDVVNYNVIGLYAGLFRSDAKNILISTDKYRNKGIAIVDRFYLDALITPVSSTTYKDIDYKDKFKKSPVGFRFGWEMLPVLTRRERKPDYPARFAFQTEAGYRMYDGVFFNVTFSFVFSRHISALSDGSDEIPRQIETE